MFNQVALLSLPKQDLLRPPGALPILASACEEKNINYEVYDFNLWLYRNVDPTMWNKIDNNWSTINPFKDKDALYYQIFVKKVKEYIDILMASKPDLIAISVFTDESAVCASEVIAYLNQLPDRSLFKIAIGGSGIRCKYIQELTNSKELCTFLLENNSIDHFMFGEGELVFRKLLEQDFNFGGLDNFDATQIDDLNQFPFPSYKKIDLTSYAFVGQPELIVTGSRGCVRKCTYCDVANYWPKFKYRSGKNIADEMYYYHTDLGINSYEFSDSLINGSLKTFRDMNKELIKHKKKDPSFDPKYKGQFICRPVTEMKERDYIDMADAGCKYIYVGIETFSNKVRYDMRKKFNNEAIDHHLAMCGKYGISNSFLMFVGYPTEHVEDHTINLEYLKRYQTYALSGVINLITFGYTAAILKDTPLDLLRDQYNIQKEYDNFEYEANWVSLDNPKLTLKERIKRWVELVSLADQLGYRQPRIKALINRYNQILDTINNKKPFIPINSSALTQEYLVKDK